MSVEQDIGIRGRCGERGVTRDIQHATFGDGPADGYIQRSTDSGRAQVKSITVYQRHIASRSDRHRGKVIPRRVQRDIVACAGS